MQRIQAIAFMLAIVVAAVHFLRCVSITSTKQYKNEAQASGLAVWNHSLALRACIFDHSLALRFCIQTWTTNPCLLRSWRS